MQQTEWLVAEDRALKAALQGLTVSDEKNASRPVGVWFGLPDPEIRAVNFPYLTIDMVGIDFDSRRARSGPFRMSDWAYLPSGVTAPADTRSALATAGSLPPQPFMLSYQVTAHSRLPQHDRQLLASLLMGPLPMQFGQVSVVVDETERRLELTSVVPAHMIDSNGKRIFRNVFNVRLETELFFFQLQQIQTVWSSASVTGGVDIGALTPINTTITVH